MEQGFVEGRDGRGDRPAARGPEAWNVDAVIEEIRVIYEKTGRQAVWPEESAAVGDYIRGLGKNLKRYANPKAIGVGGLGVVLRVEDRLLRGQPCAVKFPRPRPGSQELFAEMLSKEIERLSSIRHTGIVRIHGAGSVESSSIGGRAPFYVMDFVEGADSQEHLERTKGEGLVEIVALAGEAIGALHEADLVHCDIKPANIMIDAHGRPIITDLGTTKLYRPTDESETRIGVTRSYAPHELMQYLSVVSDSDPDNYSGAIPRSRIQKQWDLICFGKTILSWLGYTLDTGEPSVLTYEVHPYTRKYLLLLAARLLGSTDGFSWLNKEINLPEPVVDHLRLTHISGLREGVARLSGDFDLSQVVPELDPHSPDLVQVGAVEPAPLTRRVKSLLEHPSVRRLGAISQLGIVNQVYLTATHTRYEHSVGTFSNACRLLRSLYHDPYSPLFRQIMSVDDLNAIIALSLLHDTGQFPLAHDLEEIDPALFDHKRLTKAVLRGEYNPKSRGYQPLRLESIAGAIKDWGIDVDRLVTLLEVRLDRYGPSIKDRILHSIIDGPIDADKLDYLSRDSSRLGVPYGGAIDRERVINGATAIVAEERDRIVSCIGVHEKARVAAEFLTISRSAMFSQVYWHHAVRSMKAMLARAVMRIVHYLDGRGEEETNRFKSEFERFVMMLPGALSPRSPQLQLTGSGSAAPVRATAESDAKDMLGTLAATDAAVLIFLEEYMQRTHLRDSELLRSIRGRALYKRLYVWSLGDEDRTGADLARMWDGLATSQRLDAYERLEAAVAEAVGRASETNPETVTLATGVVEKVQLRVEGRLPFLLIDLPGARPGSDLPLFYVREAERRALRKDGSAVGLARESKTWEEYGEGLRTKAGKLRIFCHSDVVDPVEAALTRDQFVRLFDDACAASGNGR